MNLRGLLPLVGRLSAYGELLAALRRGQGPRAVAIGAAQPGFLARLYEDLSRPLVLIHPRPEGARRLQEELSFWLGKEPLLFPEPDALPYEVLPPDPYTVRERLRVLASLEEARGNPACPPFIVSSVRAALAVTIPRETFAATCHAIGVGMRVDMEEALHRWQRLGYELDRMVEVPGTVSRRGGILDIYPPHYELPLRIEFFGNQVESLRSFHPTTQRSVAPVATATIVPAREFLLPESPEEKEGIIRSLNLSSWSSPLREKWREELEEFFFGKLPEGGEFYAALVNRGCFFDYLPPSALVVMVSPEEISGEVHKLEGEEAELRREKEAKGELPPTFPPVSFPWPTPPSRQMLEIGEWGEEGPGSYLLPFASPPGYGGQLPVALDDIEGRLRQGDWVVIASHQARRLAELLGERGRVIAPVAEIVQPEPPGTLTLVQGSPREGWMVEGAVLLTDAELFGFVKERRLARHWPVRREELLSQLEVGDWVVHIEHGIGRFLGLGPRHGVEGEGEYLLLEYAEGDRLYVPVERIDRVSPYYGVSGEHPTLTRLGTQEWHRLKQRARESTQALARELLSLYAWREVAPGIAFPLDSPWQQELEAAFPYVETPDQARAVLEVKADMEKTRPMDRLVCGDVGYGKTEVALRAAFKAVLDGYQAAVLVPTTVLAQQHYAVFRQRLAPFPTRVEVLSRFRSDREQREVLKGLAQGTVDICIGTHRLLQKDVRFKNLGLVVIDEEQRFGVSHKERLKRMRKEVDVLSLSATPIPRTLYMALTGVRDLSTMETPPEARLPVKTYVAPYSERLVREAILRELDRDGQVFLVHNRVQTIGLLAERLSSLVPEARLIVAHGQMDEEELEERMLAFAEGQADVMVCTTIIEAGLDMPRVNTLIVTDAHRLGLSQLYQLRGRVGRGEERAYAYFLFPPREALTPAAEKRLKTIQAASELGAGFYIAMKDLEIRGAGNLLGPEQSGHVHAVGFDLYTRLLTQAVAELKAGGQVALPSLEAEAPTPFLRLPLPAYLPESYIPEDSLRLELYARMVKASSPEKAEELGRELRDRFGPLPRPAQNLVSLLSLRTLAAWVGVEGIYSEDGQVVISFKEGIKLDPSLGVSLGLGVRIGTTQIRLALKSKALLVLTLEKVLLTVKGLSSP